MVINYCFVKLIFPSSNISLSTPAFFSELRPVP